MKKNKELSLNDLDPGSVEYKRVESILIHQISEILFDDDYTGDEVEGENDNTH